MKLIESTHRLRAVGATLVEVVITVGLLVSMLLPLVGMLSIAVKNSGTAINTSVSSRISSQLIGEVQQANWNTLFLWNDRDVHFNDQGVQLDSSSDSSSSSYLARVKVNTTPVSNSTITLSPHLSHQIRVIVMVTPFGGVLGKRKLNDADAALLNNRMLPSQVHVSRALLVNMQKDL